ncbi:MAG: hypothetical protein E4H28_04545 [Gemmatimonadales bacterium]|nr:MAG: hypothetical protein E4H28_04545 [Gemmatimonadales bacterium]
MNAANNDGSGGAVSAEMRSLLERRSTLQDWLTNLDNLGSRYRPAVTDRVRTDYQGRLGEVDAELESHRGAIESSLADLRLVKDEVDQRIDTKSAQIEETELRFQIGEFDESTWAIQRDELTSDLEDIKAEQDVAVAAVLEMETVLAGLEGANNRRSRPGPKPMPELVPEPIPATKSEPALKQVIEPKPEPVVEPVIGLVKDAGPDDVFLDELEFLESLSLDDADSFDAVSRMLEDEDTNGDGSSGRAL